MFFFFLLWGAFYKGFSGTVTCFFSFHFFLCKRHFKALNIASSCSFYDVVLSSLLIWMSTFHSDHVLLGSSINKSFLSLLESIFPVSSSYLFSFSHASCSLDSICCLESLTSSLVCTLFLVLKMQAWALWPDAFWFQVLNARVLLYLRQHWRLWPNPTQCDALVIHKHFYWLSFAQGTNVSNCLSLLSLLYLGGGNAAGMKSILSRW